MSQTDRKYDGPPIHELRQPPTPAMPPKFRRRQRGKKRDAVRTSSVWHGWSNWRSSGWDDRAYSPFTGRTCRQWAREMRCDHVVKRMKALFMKDDRTGLCWLQAQGTHEQISPEFSSSANAMSWLEYEGLARGWLRVEVREFTYPKPHFVYRTVEV